MAGLKNLDKWRDFFRSCCDSSDIFEIIEHAILVAACDCPKEFKLRRGQIAETLFSCKMIKCVGCDQVELGVKLKGEEECKGDGGFEIDGGRSKESKVDSCRDDQDDDVDGDDQQMNDQICSHVSYGDAEALTNEIEKEAQIYGEVLRIKQILENSEDEPISLLLDSLKRLELMVFSVETLKATEIGKTVNVLRKHGSKDIRHLARTLIEGWKVLVDDWVSATATATATATVAGGPDGATPESLNPSSVVDEDHGLPSPPLDDLAFFATQPTTMELSRFFDGLEDEENPEHYTELKENKETSRKQTENNITVKQRPRLPVESITPPKDKKNEQSRKPDASLSKQVAPFKPKLSVADTRAARPAKLSMDQRVHTETRLQQKPEKVAVQRPPVTQQNKPRCADEASVQVKLEATKRKLHERYQQAENAKRQRTVQVMELHDLPKQDLGHKNFHGKPGNNHKRNWANGRR